MIDDEILNRSAIERLERIGGRDFLRQMIELYLQQGPERLRALADGVSAGDAARVERAAHSLKSSAGNLGAVRVQHAAQALELAGAAGTVDRAAAELVRVEFAASERELRSLLQEVAS